MPIPLMKFDNKILAGILKIMTTIEIISLSLCSKATKCFAKLNLVPCSSMEILQLPDGLRIDAFMRNQHIFMRLGPHFDGPEENIELSGDSLHILDNQEVAEVRNSNFAPYNWINHLMDIIGGDTILPMTISDNKFSMESLYKSVARGKLYMLIIGADVSFENLQKIVKIFANTFDIALNGVPIPIREYSEHILLRNFEGVVFQEIHHIRLDNLLISNSEKITVKTNSMNEKDLNKFIKLWRNRACPKLLCLKIMFTRSLDIGRILKGIQYRTEIWMEEDKPPVNSYIFRKNRIIEARVVLRDRNDLQCFEMYIDEEEQSRHF